jgi:hypothetical protein
MQALVHKCAARTLGAAVRRFVAALHEELGTTQLAAEGDCSAVSSADAMIDAMGGLGVDGESDEEFTDEMMEGMLAGMDLAWTEADEQAEEDCPLFMDELPEAGQVGTSIGRSLTTMCTRRAPGTRRGRRLSDASCWPATGVGWLGRETRRWTRCGRSWTRRTPWRCARRS